MHAIGTLVVTLSIAMLTWDHVNVAGDYEVKADFRRRKLCKKPTMTPM